MSDDPRTSELQHTPVVTPTGKDEPVGREPTTGECKLMAEKLNSNEGHLYAAGNSHYIAYLMAWLLSQVEKYRNAEPGNAKTLRTISGQSSCTYHREWELQQLWRDAAGDRERYRRYAMEADKRIEKLEAELKALREQVRL